MKGTLQKAKLMTLLNYVCKMFSVKAKRKQVTIQHYLLTLTKLDQPKNCYKKEMEFREYLLAASLVIYQRI